MFTNLAFVNGGLTSYHPNIFQIGRKLSPFKYQLDIFSSPVLCFICFGRWKRWSTKQLPYTSPNGTNEVTILQEVAP